MLRKRHALNRLAAHALVLWAACALAIVEDGEAIAPTFGFDQQLSAHDREACLRCLDNGASKSPATAVCHESSDNTEEDDAEERLRKQHDSAVSHLPGVSARAVCAAADRAAGIATPPPRSLLESVVLLL